MKFKIEINCDHAVFQNGQLTDELHLILHRVIHDLPNDIDADATEFSRNLRDTNGNHVGFVELTGDKAKPEAVVEPEVQLPRPVEFIICRDDNTWDTQVETVPAGQDPIEWMSGDYNRSHVVFIGVMDEDPEERPAEHRDIDKEPCMADDPDYNRNTDNDEVRCIACDVWTTMGNTVMVVNKDTFDKGDMCLPCWHATQT